MNLSHWSYSQYNSKIRGEPQSQSIPLIDSESGMIKFGTYLVIMNTNKDSAHAEEKKVIQKYEYIIEELLIIRVNKACIYSS